MRISVTDSTFAFTDRTCKAFALARLAANVRNADRIGTEHVLLAVSTGANEAGTKLLSDKLAKGGHTLDDVRTKVLNVIFGS